MCHTAGSLERRQAYLRLLPGRSPPHRARPPNRIDSPDRARRRSSVCSNNYGRRGGGVAKYRYLRVDINTKERRSILYREIMRW